MLRTREIITERRTVEKAKAERKRESSIQTSMFSGPSCRDASKFVEGALGEKVADT